MLLEATVLVWKANLLLQPESHGPLVAMVLLGDHSYKRPMTEGAVLPERKLYILPTVTLVTWNDLLTMTSLQGGSRILE